MKVAHRNDLDALAGDVCSALMAVADASLNGEAAVKAVSASAFAALADAGSARFVERAGKEWRDAHDGAELPPALARLLDEVPSAIEIASLEGIGTLVPISAGSIAVVLPDAAVAPARRSALRILAVGVELALAAATQSRGKLDALEEIRGLQQVALRILSAGDLDDILFSISQETKRLLSADICGVFLRDGDEMVMRGCVGNLTRHIAKIRLLRGQGLAGRVFQTGVHCVVGDYLSSDAVSQEYAELVRAERIRSALGAPLRVNDELIGVLEVWRRRRSTFTDADVRRLLALSTLTAIAIHNARLYESQKVAVEQLTSANERLQQQNDVIRQSAAITGEVIQALLDGGGLGAIARIVAQHTGAEVVFLSTELEPMGEQAPPAWYEGARPRIAQVVGDAAALRGNASVALSLDGGWLSMRPVIAARERVGWLCAHAGKAPDPLSEITMGQAAMAAALHHQEQRAASQARLQTIGGVAWDLLEGRGAVRETAVARAKELQIDLAGALRVVHLGIDAAATAAAGEHRGHAVHDIVERSLGKALRLIVARGNLLVAVIGASDAARTKAIIESTDDRLVRETAGLRTRWGVSAACNGARQLHAAHREAAAALLLVGKLGSARNVALHDEMGVLGVLLKVRSDADLGSFVGDTLGKVLAHDAAHRRVLTKTVRTWLDCNCAQQAAARKLFVHEKTVRYRLNQFEALSGLDLSRHDDRMRVDLALGMHAITSGEDEAR